MAALIIQAYDTPKNSDIMKAAAPMTGGMIWPPVDAAASTAPAKYGLYPTFFIRGMVKAPVVAVFAMELPFIVPRRPLANMATFAGPPVILPAALRARSLKNCAPPDSLRNAPNRINRNTKVAETPRAVPYIPSGTRYICWTILSTGYPLCMKSPGAYLP